MTGVLLRRHRLTGKSPCDHEGRDQGDVSISQGMPEIARNHQKLERGMKEMSLTVP